MQVRSHRICGSCLPKVSLTSTQVPAVPYCTSSRGRQQLFVDNQGTQPLTPVGTSRKESTIMYRRRPDGDLLLGNSRYSNGF